LLLPRESRPGSEGVRVWSRTLPRRPRPPVEAVGGYTLLEILFVSALICILTGVSLLSVLAAVDRSRGAAAARYLATRTA
jgi:type II secretory pathway pseudopilin PulG